jgi:hypothetical protein
MRHGALSSSFVDGAFEPTRKGIWAWWEGRRFRYNRDLFLVGVVTWLLVVFAGSASVKPGDDFEEPIMMVIGPFLYGILANIAYTTGPIYDSVFYIGVPRKRLFKAGYLVSIVLTALPGTWAVIAWITTLITGRKL